MRIGYTIHELTTEVHDALSKKEGWIWMDLIHVQRLWFKPRLLCWHQHHMWKMLKP